MSVQMIPSSQLAGQQQGALINKALSDMFRMGLLMAGTGGAIRGARGLWNLGRRNLSTPETPKLTSRFMDVPIAQDEEEQSKVANEESGLLGLAKKLTWGPATEAFKGNVSSPKNWPLYLPGMFAVGAGSLYGGYKGVDAIMDARRKQQQEEELEAAKSRYEDALLGKGALAEDLDTLFDLWKAAKDKVPGGLADGRGDSSFPEDALAAGQKVEMEHTNDPAIAKEVAKDHLTESDEYYHELAEMEEDLEKDAAGLPDTYGRAMGWGLALGLPISLVTGLATYDLTKKRDPASVLSKAKQKRRRELSQRRPPALYARPQMVSRPAGAADVPDEDEMAGEPLDKAAAIKARLARRGFVNA